MHRAADVLHRQDVERRAPGINQFHVQVVPGIINLPGLSQRC